MFAERLRAPALLPGSDDLPDAGPARRGGPTVLALALNFGKVGAAAVSRYMMIAYDDLYSIELFNRKQRPWWRRNGDDAADAAERRPPRPRFAAGARQRLSTKS